MAAEQPPQSEWNHLRELLLRQEQCRLDELEAAWEEEPRRQRLHDDLPITLTRLGDNPQLRASLVRPVTAALRDSIERDRDGVASLLFPVMGPAIRRAVQESLRNVLQRINLALEYGLSPRAWRWRLQAWRTGESFAQIVLRHSLAFSVDEIFIIHRSSGLVSLRRSRREVLALDQDAVASMLTAIQSFLQQSLGSVADDPLRTVELGSATLWLVNGPEALLAAVIRGEAPLSLREALQETLEEAHQQLGERLTDYQGELIEDPLVERLLTRHLIEQIPPPRRTSRVVWLGLLLSLPLLLGFVHWAWAEWRLAQDHQRFRALVQKTPGLVLVQSASVAGQVQGLILRDPLALSLADIRAQLELPNERIAVREQAYLSQEPEFLIQRLRGVANLDATQILVWEQKDAQSQVSLHGRCSQAQWQQLKQALALLAPQVLFSTPPLSAAELYDWLGVPDTVMLAWDGRRLSLSGQLTFIELERIQAQLAQWPVQHELNLSGLNQALAFAEQAAEQDAVLSAIVESINGRRLNFSTGVQFSPLAQQRIPELARQLQQLLALAATPDRPGVAGYTIHLQGMSDGVGNSEENQILRQARADTVRAALVAAGISADRIVSTAAQEEAPAGYNPALRYVELRVEAK